jgi:hypothetical protein
MEGMSQTGFRGDLAYLAAAVLVGSLANTLFGVWCSTRSPRSLSPHSQ